MDNRSFNPEPVICNFGKTMMKRRATIFAMIEITTTATMTNTTKWSIWNCSRSNATQKPILRLCFFFNYHVLGSSCGGTMVMFQLAESTNTDNIGNTSGIRSTDRWWRYPYISGNSIVLQKVAEQRFNVRLGVIRCNDPGIGPFCHNSINFVRRTTKYRWLLMQSTI